MSHNMPVFLANIAFCASSVKKIISVLIPKFYFRGTSDLTDKATFRKIFLGTVKEGHLCGSVG